MGENNFNRKQCIKALKKLGFVFIKSRRGKHDKYQVPAFIKNNSQTSFIMIPRHNKLRCQREIISEIEKIGGEELLKSFRKLL